MSIDKFNIQRVKKKKLNIYYEVLWLTLSNLIFKCHFFYVVFQKYLTFHHFHNSSKHFLTLYISIQNFKVKFPLIAGISYRTLYDGISFLLLLFKSNEVPISNWCNIGAI